MASEIPKRRKWFNDSGGAADALAKQIGIAERAMSIGRQPSRRFSYFADDEKFAIVAGTQEGHNVDRALAHGLRLRQDRKLVLVLPESHGFATQQRAAWLTDDARPELWVHDDTTATKTQVPTTVDAANNLREFVASRPGNPTPEQEFAAATTPLYLGERGPGVVELVEWATAHPGLDAGHRRGERAWHCLGLRVLSLKPSSAGGIKIRAGIHWTTPGKLRSESLSSGEDLDLATVATLQERVGEAIDARVQGHQRLHDARDEHWLQAVLRRRPESVGVEQPALREVPAWRPVTRAERGDWGRGFIDLVGLDGHGDVRIVETKLSRNVDDLLVFQGLDYFIWAQVYGAALRARLGAPKSSRLIVHYVLGADPDTGEAQVSPDLRAQLDALRPEFSYRFQIVYDWFNSDPWSAPPPTSNLLPPGVLPGESKLRYVVSGTRGVPDCVYVEYADGRPVTVLGSTEFARAQREFNKGPRYERAVALERRNGYNELWGPYEWGGSLKELAMHVGISAEDTTPPEVQREHPRLGR